MKARSGLILFASSLIASSLSAQVRNTPPSPADRVVPTTAPAQAAGTQDKHIPITWGDRMMMDPARKDLPFIHELIPLGFSAVGSTAYITDARYVDLTDAELAKLPGIGKPGSEPEMHTFLGYARKHPYAMVDIYPYRRDPQSGLIQELVDYKLQVVEEKRAGGAGHAKSATYPDHSKMASGSWYRFMVANDGAYKLTYPFLQQLGVDVTSLASDQINIYGNHAGLLPFKNSPAVPNDLLLNAIEVIDGGDGQFGPNDYVLFYASSSQNWNLNNVTQRFSHTKNVYSDSADYFVGIGVDPPKRVAPASLSSDPATEQVTGFNDRQVIDRDLVNIIKSGRTWYGDTYDITTTYNYDFEVPFLRSGEQTCLTMDVLGRTYGNNSSTFHVQVGSSYTHDIVVPGVGIAPNGPTGKESLDTMCFLLSGSSVPITVTFIKSDPASSVGWMNWLEVNAPRDLKMVGSQLGFRDLKSVGPGKVAEFTLDLATGVQRIWEITDPTDVRNVEFTDNGTQKVFRIASDSLRQFIAFTDANYPEPTAVGPVPNQDLHGTPMGSDLVIVCPPVFQGEAQRLADRRTSEGLSVVMVSPQEVFNEFSSGQRDATAIKRYMKMLFDRANEEASMPRYLLLFGDGSYNNISLAPSNQNYIPTYETANSIDPTQSYVSDDYFALLDDTKGESTADLVDIGVGRMPVSDVTQARNMVNKILNYDKLMLLTNTGTTCSSGSDGGANDWRNQVLFASDDQTGDGFEGPIHMINSEALANKVESEHPCLNINKVYMDAYVQISTPGGQRYPEAQAELRDRVQKGQLLVNYVGHGGEVGWAHERFLDNGTILGWTNLDRLPIFMTATCEFTRWDDPSRTSAGENVFLNPDGGGIGLMSTTRLAFSSSNQSLALYFFGHVFSAQDELGRAERFGDIYRQTKVQITSVEPGNANHRNFTLIGDPSTRLAMARNNAFIDAITDTLGAHVDTLKALSVVRVTGHVADTTGQLLSDFNGVVIPTVFDKETLVNTLANDPPGVPFPFMLRKNIIYRGKVAVTSGQFSFTFMVPKDINYQVGPGRISIYAESLTTNACGYTNAPRVGGINPNAVSDVLGPKIDLYMNDERFVSGGITNESPLLYAKLFDENGINTLGSSIGHDLTAVVDANTSGAIVLNDVYEADLNTFKSGKVRYRMKNVAEGRHTLTMKAWDVFDNSSQKSTDFVVAPTAQLALEHVLNYPNPFTTHTDFYFEHNRPCGNLDVRVQVFTIAGRLVKTLIRQLACDGFRSEPMAWDGLDDYGDKLGRGVYVYRLSIATEQGESAEKYEKLVILR